MRLRTGALALLLTLVCATGAWAQLSASAPASINADVVDGLTILVSRNLEFGITLQSSTKTVPVTSASAAKVRFYGKKNQNVTVTLTVPASLTRVGGGGTIPFAWTGAYHNSADDPATATALTTTTATVRLQSSVTATTAYAYLYLGGTLTVATPATGAYTATINIAAAY